MFTLIVQQLTVMIIIMVIGFVCFKAKILNLSTNKAFSTFLLMVVNPALIIYVYQIDFEIRIAILLFYSLLAATASHIIGIVVSNFFIPRKNNPECAVERISAVYSNCSFMGIPLVSATIGLEGVFFLSAYIAMVNLLLWTHGIGLIKNGFSLKYLKEGLLSPVFIATVVAIGFYFTQIRLPVLLVDSLGMLKVTVTPLGMMTAGIALANANLKNIFTKGSIHKISFVRLLLIPFLTLGLLVLLNLDRDVAYTILIASACPPASAGMLMAIRYGKNQIYASEIFASSALLFIVTLPFVIFIADLIL